MAYAEQTKVPFQQSVGEISVAIRKAGAQQIGQFESDKDFAIQFTLADRMIRFRVALQSEASRLKPDQQRRQRGRALLLVIKAKLESVETGIETVEEAFLANVVMSDGYTVYERAQRHIAIEYQSGRPSATMGGLQSRMNSDGQI
jgi:hypothetical protein